MDSYPSTGSIHETVSTAQITPHYYTLWITEPGQWVTIDRLRPYSVNIAVPSRVPHWHAQGTNKHNYNTSSTSSGGGGATTQIVVDRVEYESTQIGTMGQATWKSNVAQPAGPNMGGAELPEWGWETRMVVRRRGNYGIVDERNKEYVY